MTITQQHTTPLEVKSARELITPEAFTAVAGTVQRNNEGMAENVAEAITEEALKFVAACSAAPRARLKPSRVVDEGWHALILHTTVYAELCRSLHRFVHHVPERPDVTRHNPGVLARTQEAIKVAGYKPDPLMWNGPADNTIPVAATCEHTEPPPAGCGADCSNTGPN
ncbi:glycine-rich domain-containing protein [Streptomyces sp. NPDC014733]|uniref:glycine-rich domain-containing protein n=1 Tax=Streptomyces sp. NPDC014733 TaxID=3364885 RepID=UPI0036FF874C